MRNTAQGRARTPDRRSTRCSTMRPCAERSSGIAACVNSTGANRFTSNTQRQSSSFTYSVGPADTDARVVDQPVEAVHGRVVRDLVDDRVHVRSRSQTSRRKGRMSPECRDFRRSPSSRRRTPRRRSSPLGPARATQASPIPVDVPVISALGMLSNVGVHGGRVTARKYASSPWPQDSPSWSSTQIDADARPSSGRRYWAGAHVDQDGDVEIGGSVRRAADDPVRTRAGAEDRQGPSAYRREPGRARPGRGVARLLGLGARGVDIGQGEPSWFVLADPEGNEFCLLRRRRD